ncbi:MAG: RNA methyltransferase [Chloroflexi bacterium]|nr:RNA methyltransferase [Chloroflexota bacterium]MCY4246148.1 RNA methyltransferase [Chloroflexota bacterium]
MQPISSTQNKRVRYVKSLANKARLRRGERKLILEGDRLIADALARGGAGELALYSPQRADYAVIAQLQKRGCALLAVTEAVLRHLSDTQQPPGILAVFHIPKPPIAQPCRRVLILDGVGEPGNLGTILRSASAAGVDLAILAPGCCDAYSGKTLRAGMGAHFRLPIVEANWREIADFCRGLQVYAARADADCLHTSGDWAGDWALIVGNEAHGLSQAARRLAAHEIAIPMARSSESLNVASAAAVILFEAQRQRLRSDSTLARASAVD